MTPYLQTPDSRLILNKYKYKSESESERAARKKND